MVIGVSILLKTIALLLWPAAPLLAMVLFVGSAVMDGFMFRAEVNANEKNRWHIPGHTLALNAAALIAGLAAQALGERATMTWKEGLPWAAHATAWLLRATGLPAAASGGFVHWTTMAGPLRLAASWDALGLDLLLVVWVLSAVMILYRASDWRTITYVLLRLTLMLWVVALLRFALWILLFDTFTTFVSHETESLPVSLFIRPLIAAALFLPFLPALLKALASIPDRNDNGSYPAGAPIPWVGRLRWRTGFAWALVAFLVFFSVWEPRGKPQSGRILIDGYRAQWSPADRPYDHEWYGADSGYNYACMRRWFDAFYETEVLDGPIGAHTLDDASVLVVYLPDRPYRSDEIRRIEAFVRGGGGLLLIGDHTNVFGSTSHLNALCRRLGMQFRYDVLFDLDTHFFQMFDGSRSAPRLLHGMDFMKLRGAASIRPTSWSTRLFMTVDNTKGLPSTYSVGNFYPPPHDDPRMTFGRYGIAAASRVGSGRVVAFADSTIFSNFEIFYPGKYELLLNMATWLDHRDTAWRGFARRLAALSVLLLTVLLIWRAHRPRAVLGALAGVLFIVGVAGGLARYVASRTAYFPAPRRPLRGVFFVADATDPSYILRDFTSDAPYDQRYTVFIQWVLRTGAFSGFRLAPPGAGDALYEHLRDDPEAETALALILRDETQLPYLEIIASDTGSRHALLLFSSTFEREQIESALINAGLVDSSDALAPAWSVWPNGDIMITANDRRLFLVFDAERFSDRRMGITEKSVPNEAMRQHFDQAFRLIDRLFDDTALQPRGGTANERE